jgi:hypothetical protein
MEGILRCSRYSFGPNRLHYCGPDQNTELRAQIEAASAGWRTNPSLMKILREFKTLYPYLRLIAKANNILDPFDSRVVEAYWLGNELLEKVGKQRLYNFLVDDLEIKKKTESKEMEWLEKKISEGAVPHHSFHVLNLWRQTSGERVAQEFASLDECRVAAGEIISVSGPEIVVLTEPLFLVAGKIIFGAPVKKTLIRALEAEYDIEQLQPGQFVSFHWSVPCEVLTKEQTANLRKYTLQNINFANQTL